ncbi:MAG: methyltransferase domain-containing protein [Candidatus Sulfotelmatobacter sp.]
MNFPRRFLPALRCIKDGGQLSVFAEVRADEGGITEGTLRCTECSREYTIENGILRLMSDSLTRENQLEITLLNQAYGSMPDVFEPAKSGWRSRLNDSVEIPPHLNMLKAHPDQKVLEIGCGDGRYTVLLSQLGAHVLAFDFSIAALQRASKNVTENTAPTSYKVKPARNRGEVGLVQADVTSLSLAARMFDRCISATPLDSRDERMKLFHTIADALKDDGIYVCGVEYDDLYRRLFGLPVMRRYSPGGVLIEHLAMAELKREAGAYFGRLNTQLIRVHLPLVHKLPLWLSVPMTRAAGWTPIIRQLGNIVMVAAARPIRIPPEGERRSGYLKAKNLYRWYKRKRGQEPFWDLGDPV